MRKRVFNAPQVDTTAENEHKGDVVKHVRYLLCCVRSDTAIPGARYGSSYVRLVVEDIKGQDTHIVRVLGQRGDKPFR